MIRNPRLESAQVSDEALLVDLFVRLAAIPSPSGSEGACADAVSHELTALGLEVERDDAGMGMGSSGANLYCRVAPTAAGTPLFFCAHLDTVPPTAPLDPIIVDGVVRNATPSIVGADNKAAVAVLVEATRTLVEQGRPHAGIELLFTIGEEQGLRGIRAFDSSRLHSRSGFALDHSGSIGRYVVAAPSRFIVHATVRGRAAHAGIAPEDGVSAIVPLARAIASFPSSTARATVNVGFVRAGTAVNVVPEHAETFVDIRSLDDETARRLVETVTRTIADSAASGGCGAEIEVESAYGAYRVPPDSRAVRLAAVAFERVGRTIEPFETRGGSDANVLRARGLDCVNLAHAVVDLHGPDEHVAVADLALMKRVVLEIVAAACSTPDTPDG